MKNKHLEIDYEEVNKILPPLNSAINENLQQGIMKLAITSKHFLNHLVSVFPLELAPGDIYNKLLVLCYQYYEEFKTAPEENISQLLLHEYVTNKSLSEDLYNQTISYINKIMEMKLINKEYAYEVIDQFIMQRRLFVCAMQAVKEAKANRIDNVKNFFQLGLEELGRGNMLDDAVDLLNDDALIDKLIIDRNSPRPYLMKWSIDPFDKAGLVFDRKNFVIIAAPEKTGKSWAGIYLAKIGLLNGLNVLFTSHGDLNTREIIERFNQTFSGALHWRHQSDDSYEIKVFDQNYEIDTDLISVDTIANINKVKNGINAVKSFAGKLIIRDWAMNSCSIKDYDKFLDQLKRNGFEPDIIINDYAEIMKMETNDRNGIDEIYKNHKRMAGERNSLVVTFSQVNKKAYGKDWISMSDFAEDKRKAAHCDYAYAICQNEEELENSTARLVLFVDRHLGKKGTSCVILQNFNLGQFVVDSAPYKKPEVEKDDE